MSTALNVLFSPGAAFRKLKEKPAWIIPFVIVVLVVLAVTAVGVSKMDYADVKVRAEEMMRNQGLAEEQIQQRLEASDKIMNNPVTKYALPLVVVLFNTALGMVIVALILMLMVPLLGGAKGNFVLGLVVVAHAGMVRVLAAIVRLILLMLRGAENTMTSLALAVPNVKGFLYHFLSRVDVFTIWEIILIALGMKIVYDLKDNRSYYYLFGLWLVYIALASLIPGAAMKPR
jgi:hypothetical protein